MWAASLRAVLGDHRTASAELAANLVAVERGFLGTQNYPFTVHNAAKVLWWTASANGADVLERNLREKVLAPDFSYPESDGRWTAALLCALTGRHDEARGLRISGSVGAAGSSACREADRPLTTSAVSGSARSESIRDAW